MIISNTANTVEVISFTNGPEITYTITLDQLNSIMVSYSYIDYNVHGHNCKHMYLVNLIEGIALKPLPVTTQSAAEGLQEQQQQQPITNEDALFDEAVLR
jgi:hypothetical protein